MHEKTESNYNGVPSYYKADQSEKAKASAHIEIDHNKDFSSENHWSASDSKIAQTEKSVKAPNNI